MWLILFRAFIVALLAYAGYLYNPFGANDKWSGLALGLITALGVITLERKIRSVPGHNMVGALAGGVTGLVGARLVWWALEGLATGGANHFFQILLVVFLGYTGIVICGQKGEWFEP